MSTRGLKNASVISAILVTTIMLCLMPLPGFAATWYVRTDGGDITQCNGHADEPYPGSGTGQACAVNHLFWLFPPPAKSPLIAGGDTVVIGPGQYMMGINAIGDQAPNTSACQGGTGTFTCMMAAIPSGPDATHPTTIIGANWDTKATPPPEFWGAGRTDHIFNLTGSNNVVLQYLDITDHAQCGYNFTANPSLMCNRTVAPYGYQADYGIYATDSSNVLLKDVDLHGLSSGALHAGRLTDWTFDSVKIEGNAFNGWNGDVGHGAYGSGTDSSMHGTITMKNSKVNYNGCVENYPLTGVYPDIATGGCYGQGQGGYGDGLGMYYTEGNWVFQDVEIMHNTQDGLDLLYHTGQTGTVTLKRVRSEGNAGQQLKFGASADIENSVVVGNCNYFYNNPIATQSGFSHCRASGTAIATQGWRSGHHVTIANSTIVGPNKIFIEAGTGSSASNAAGAGNITGSAVSIVYDNQFAVSQAEDTVWLRWQGSFNPNNGQVIARWNSYNNNAALSGTWISDGNGIYHMTGIGAQTGGVYNFNDVVKSYICDGTEKIISRNNIFLGMEWWSTSTQAIVPGIYSDLLYLDGWNGNGAGSCAATNPVVFDNKDSIAYNTKINQCPNSNNVLCADPLLEGVPPLSGYNDIWTYGNKWKVVPQSNSPAVGKTSTLPGSLLIGNYIVPSNDINGLLRPITSITWGAYEYNASPIVAITSPKNGSPVINSPDVVVVATSNWNISKIELYENSVLVKTITPPVSSDTAASNYSYIWKPTFVSNGDYTLFARVYDSEGKIGQSDNVTINVTDVVPYSISDALLALQISVGIVKPSASQRDRIDVAPVLYGKSAPDGKIDIGDALVILSDIVGVKKLIR